MENLDLALNPPCKVEEVISFSLQFDNLQKYLAYITKSNSILIEKINDFHTKMSEFDQIKTRFDELDLKMETYSKKFDDVENSISAHQNKIMEAESKIWSITSKVEEGEDIIKAVTEKSTAIDENLNNLNRLTEESIKSIHKMNETVEKVRTQQESMMDTSEGMEKRITKVIDDLNDKERKTKEVENKFDTNLEKKINETKEMVKDNVDRLHKKISDAEATIIKVVDTVSSGGAGRRNSTGGGKSSNNINNGSNSSNQNNSNSNVNSIQNEAMTNLFMSEIKKTGKDIEDLKQEKKTMSDNIDLLQRNLEEIKDQLKSVSNRIEAAKENIDGERINSSMLLVNNDQHDQHGTSNSHRKEENLQSLQNITGNINTEAINDNIQKLSDNLKIVSQNLGHKTNREDFEKLNKQIKAEVERISDKLNESTKLLEMKIKTITANSGRGSLDNTFDPSFGSSLQESIQKLTKEIIEKEISEVDLNKNDNFKDAQFKIDYNKTEIDKIFESIIEIRKTFVDTSQPLEETVKEANNRILDIELNMRRVKMQMEDVMRNLEGDNQGEEEVKEASKKESEVSNGNSGSLREYIRNLASTQKILGDKVERIGQKQENMNAEILAKVKKDLQFESNRILEDFKQDLKTSINKIEDQLREKVDRFNLDEFGKKIDSKFVFEINKKLDRNDLKKNTNLINRKIDTLENKISKTLVDTLIDLQMEEAPLIVKKSVGGEKCASCNQYLPHSHNHHDQGNHYEHKNLYKTTSKFHATGYRPGESNKVSSGNMININNPINEVSEDERGNNINNSKKAFQLPDINLNKSNPDLASKKKVAGKYAAKDTSNINSDNEMKNLNALINEDLEKKYLGPNDLIKTANKVYDNKK